MLVKHAFESTHDSNLSIMNGMCHSINDVALGNNPYTQRTARAPASCVKFRVLELERRLCSRHWNGETRGTHTHTHTHTHIHTHTHTLTHTHTHINTYIHIYTHIYRRMEVRKALRTHLGRQHPQHPWIPPPRHPSTPNPRHPSPQKRSQVTIP